MGKQSRRPGRRARAAQRKAARKYNNPAAGNEAYVETMKAEGFIFLDGKWKRGAELTPWERRAAGS